MKKIKYLFGVFLFIVLFQSMNVFAITGTYTHNGFEYSIKKIYMDVYSSKYDSEGIFAGYEGEKLYTIELPDTFTINPQYIEDEYEKDNFYGKETYINLGLSATKEQILNLLKTQVTTLDNDHHYFIRIMVDYSIDKVPTEYNYNYRNMYSETNNKLKYSEDTIESDIKASELTLGQTYSQVFNNFEYKMKGEEEYCNYSSSYTEDIFTYLDFYLNYTSYSSLDESKKQMLAKKGEEEKAKKEFPNYLVANEKHYQLLSFVGYSNIKEYLNTYPGDYQNYLTRKLMGNWNITNYDSNKINPITSMEGANESAKSEETVKVPNTAKKVGTIIYICSMICFVIGGAIIFYALKKKKTSF